MLVYRESVGLLRKCWFIVEVLGLSSALHAFGASSTNCTYLDVICGNFRNFAQNRTGKISAFLGAEAPTLTLKF